MIGRIGDEVYHPALARCEGCGESTILCECDMDTDGRRCCGVCTHIHDPATLARYGQLER
jgi:hypothetical protein